MGYTEANCRTLISVCSSNPCKNKAQCSQDGVGQFTCICPIGFTGQYCQSEVNNCMSSPCRNGAVCNSYLNFYNCTCKPGFSGYNCQTTLSACFSNPCSNNGFCQSLQNGGFLCNCFQGYTGSELVGRLFTNKLK